jgi:hypothetical protein
MWDFFV